MRCISGPRLNLPCRRQNFRRSWMRRDYPLPISLRCLNFKSGFPRWTRPFSRTG
jgi:hypothetical protein